ncbi:hypothetical protein K435DRAFT_771724 [Dendrothele bispora CBS 962.96]|uniref:Uncharacterized protein n=1 Tax=Dendrothele bispora (strain CBS 962.96) TaxID=1314807 RepID=A0A4V4HIV6_DENBC|nr:hypothetical protein K435DRAFT_771724 [Dendrothele bispora CBS 962.96]
MNTYANPSVLNTGQNTGPEHNLWPDIDMSSVNFGWMDNSLLQSPEFWNGVLVDMNVSGYEGLHLNTQGYQGYNPNFHGE